MSDETGITDQSDAPNVVDMKLPEKTEQGREREIEIEHKRWTLLMNEFNRVGVKLKEKKYKRVLIAMAMWGDALSEWRHTQTKAARNSSICAGLDQWMKATGQNRKNKK